jgi:hypothetical protein
MESKDTQLPAEVLDKITQEAEAIYNKLDSAARDYDEYEYGLPMFEKCKEPIERVLTEYASKLHQEQQENAQLKQWKKEAQELLNPILDYGQSKEAGIPLGESITVVVLERCKRFENAGKLFKKIIDLYDLTPEDDLYNEIKTFLDGKH